MSTARRYDAAHVAPGGATRDKRGFLSVPAFVTRVGVLTYKRADGTVVRELRHPDHVFHADSLESLRDAPVTVGHPGSGLTWVDPNNASDLEVGVAGDGQREGHFVRSRLSVRRADAIKRIDAKELVEVSCGYEAEIDPTPGVFEGQAYDQVQTNITYNHVALLPPGGGRCGRDVRLRADSADAVIVDEEPAASGDVAKAQKHGESVVAPAATDGGESMNLRKMRVDGVEYELPETAASVLEKLVSDRDAAKAECGVEKKRADAAEAERDVIKGQLADARDPRQLGALVTQRVDLERQATKVLGAEQRFDGLSDREVREKVLTVIAKSFKSEGRSDDAVTAAFDCAISSEAHVNHGLKLVGQALNHTEEQPSEQRTDALDFAKAFAEVEAKRQSAWKGKAS